MAAKKESTFVTMVSTLLIVSVVAATSLAFIYKLTKEPIAKAKLEKQKSAIKDVMPDFNNDPISDKYKVGIEAGDSMECYPAYMDNEFLGIAVKSNTMKGFSGEMVVMTGFDPEGSIINTKILEHKETPGLGDKTQKEKSLSVVENEDGSVDSVWWTKQFSGKKPEFAQEGSFNEPKNIKVSKKGGEIDAITAATITSDAYCDAVNRGYRAFTIAVEQLQETEK